MSSSLQFLALIPARYASTRFPGKPLADLMGKPMIQHVYEKVSAVFAHAYVATDDRRIADAVEAFGGRVVMTSTEHRSGTDRCREALETIEKQSGEHFDVVVNVQGDEPFVARHQLELLVGAFEDKQTQIATLVKAFGPQEDIFDVNSPKVVVSAEHFALYFSRSVVPFLRGVEPALWATQHTYFKHIGLYAYRSDVLCQVTELKASVLEVSESLEQLRWLENGFKIKVAQTDTQTIAIDTPEDLQRALAFMREQVGE